MINWLNCGNDYGKDLGRLIESEQAKSEFLHECRNYSQNFAHFIQFKLTQIWTADPTPRCQVQVAT